MLSVTLAGHAVSALLPESLAIDYNAIFTIDLNTGKGVLTGGHDGYPSYEVVVGDAKIFDFQQQWLWDLLGNANVPFNVNFNLRQPRVPCR